MIEAAKQGAEFQFLFLFEPTAEVRAKCSESAVSYLAFSKLVESCQIQMIK